MRKQKKPTAKEALARLGKLELENTMLRLDIRQRRIALLDSLWTWESMVEQILEQAGTINEARTWFKEYQDVMDNLPPLDDGTRVQVMKDELAKINIFLDGIPDHGDFIDQLDLKSP